jgi:orotate phosphoribosyltransferase
MVNEIARMLIEHGAVQYGEFILSSGEKSRYYIDIKTSVTDPGLLRAIGEQIAGRHQFDAVAGVAVGGVPIAVAVSLASGKPYAIIRREEKAHGKSGVVIGPVKDRQVLLVEDVTTKGGSALYGVQALRRAGANISAVVTVVDREQGASETLAAEGVELFSLVKVHDLLRKD